MVDLKKVIKGLECCMIPGEGGCDDCPYVGKGICQELLGEHALALLKEQEPRVMTWDEAQKSVTAGPFIILEVRDSTRTELDFGVLVDDYYEMSEGSVLDVADIDLMADEYAKRFRIWTSHPTDEVRRATPWN